MCTLQSASERQGKCGVVASSRFRSNDVSVSCERIYPRISRPQQARSNWADYELIMSVIMGPLLHDDQVKIGSRLTVRKKNMLPYIYRNYWGVWRPGSHPDFIDLVCGVILSITPISIILVQ